MRDLEKDGALAYLDITKHTPEHDAVKHAACTRNCQQCQHFCKVGSGFLVEKDFSNIAKHLGITEAKLKMNYLEPVRMYNKTMWRPKLLKEEGKPYGQCIFFNEQEKCTIHGVKPTHCKVATCSDMGEQLSEWFVLNHIIDVKDPVAVREWAQKLKVKPTIPGGNLHELVPDEKHLKKILSYEIMMKS